MIKIFGWFPSSGLRTRCLKLLLLGAWQAGSCRPRVPKLEFGNQPKSWSQRSPDEAKRNPGGRGHELPAFRFARAGYISAIPTQSHKKARRPKPTGFFVLNRSIFQNRHFEVILNPTASSSALPVLSAVAAAAAPGLPAVPTAAGTCPGRQFGGRRPHRRRNGRCVARSRPSRGLPAFRAGLGLTGARRLQCRPSSGR